LKLRSTAWLAKRVNVKYAAEKRRGALKSYKFHLQYLNYVKSWLCIALRRYWLCLTSTHT